MLSRYSVKKPYTVVVSIVLVLILGVVSFGKMTTDLLPSMNLPYAIVITSYPGASPETVETVVTRPVEQSMATVTDIENVSSQSSENLSMVTLEFQESTDMDSASIEIREKLDQISGYWDESVGKPMIMKLNPDMMPIMIAAVEVDDRKAAEVTDYVKSQIQPELESISGVASVSATGNITESVEVLIRQDKVNEANTRVMEALDKQFYDKEKELIDAHREVTDGQIQLEEGKAQLNEGQAQLDAGKEALVSGLAQGQQQIAEAQQQLSAGAEMIDSQLALLDEKQEEIHSGRALLTQARSQAEQGLTQISEMQTQLAQLSQALEGLDSTEEELNSQLADVENNLASVEQQEAEFGAMERAEAEAFTSEADGFTSEGTEGFTDGRSELSQLWDTLQAQRAEFEEAVEAILNGLTDVETNRGDLEEQLQNLVASVGAATLSEAQEFLESQAISLQTTIADLDTKLAALDVGQSQLDTGRQQLLDAKTQLASGQSQLDAGKIEMNTQQLLASIDLSVAQSQLDAGSSQMAQTEAQLSQAQKQLEEGEKQLADAKAQTKENTSLTKLITKDLIKGILAGENFSMPAGYLQEGEDEFLVRVGDKLTDTESLEELVILDLGIEGLEPIRLKDVANISTRDDSNTVYARLNGNPGVMLTIEKQTGYSTGDVTDQILERIEQIEEEQKNVHFFVLMDQGVYIDLVVDSVMDNMIYGAILAVLILFIFMKDVRPTLVIACSIPISVVAAVVLMYFSGVTMNVISLSGLALGIGMLVDNSIVVIENIDRLRQEGVPVRKAAVEGARQVAGAIAASTLTTVCVFAPIVFTEGITRQLFVDMGLTIAYSLLASLVVALTLVPMMSAGMLKNSKPKTFRLLDKIRNGYGKILGAALRIKPLVLLLALALLGGSAYLAVQKGTAFMPEMESTQASMTIIPTEGATFEEMTAQADAALSAIEDIEDIESIGAMAGGSSVSSMTGGGSADSVSVYLLLKEDKKLSGAQLEREILKRTADLPCEVKVTTQSMDMSALGGSGVQIRIKGKELDELSAIARDIAKLVGETQGIAAVSDGQEKSDTEFRIVINKAKAMEHQLTVAQVYQEVQKRLAEASSATTLSTAIKDYSVFVRDEKEEQLTREDLKNLSLEVTGADGTKQTVRLGDIAAFEEAEGPQTIQRDAQSRYMTVSAELEDGYNIGLVSSEVEKRLTDYEMPEGYTLEMVGEDETINDAMEQLMLMLLLALAFMYLIMVAQFQSLLSPFIIMFTVPLAFTGGFMGLLAADMEISVIAMIGFVMLSGIIVNNGIVLVDYTNQLRKEGMEKREALIQAGKDRLRPIVMTALTTILGLSTMAAGMGMGGGMVQPMAVVTIGGLIYGTLLTLFVVPCIYDFLNRREYKNDEMRLEERENGNPDQ